MFIVGKIFIQLILVGFFVAVGCYGEAWTIIFWDITPDFESMLCTDFYLMIRIQIRLKLDFSGQLSTTTESKITFLHNSWLDIFEFFLNEIWSKCSWTKIWKLNFLLIENRILMLIENKTSLQHVKWDARKFNKTNLYQRATMIIAI